VSELCLEAREALRNENDIKLIGRTFIGDVPPSFIPKAHDLIVQTVRGERGSKQYLLLWRDAIADSEWYESLSLKDFRKLSATLPVRKRMTVTVKSTPMDLLLAAIGKAIYEKNKDCPDGMDPDEWRFNLRQARKRLTKRPRRILHDLGAIYGAIIPHIKMDRRVRQILCKQCHTPMLFGYIVNGHKVTRRKEFCEDSCKMNWERRHSPPSNGSSGATTTGSN